MKEGSKEGKVESDWEEESRRFFENRGMKLEELERRRREGEEWCNELMREDRKMDRRGKIRVKL